ncbi:hypothetical protein Bbelb_048220 [Branchiostoma belcheri]|nr:hypothetical protein Bbelb_048220 [Branchiostoma belcheri]
MDLIPVAGRIQHFLSQWITICSDPWVLSTVSKGLRVHLTGRPFQLVPPEEVTGLNLEAENLMAAEGLHSLLRFQADQNLADESGWKLQNCCHMCSDARRRRTNQEYSLGGNSKTAVICAVTPAEEEQTKSTLQFATTSKSIKNRPVVNEVLSEMAMLNRAKKEIANLQKKIKEMNSQTGFLTLEQDNEELRQKLQEQDPA